MASVSKRHWKYQPKRAEKPVTNTAWIVDHGGQDSRRKRECRASKKDAGRRRSEIQTELSGGHLPRLRSLAVATNKIQFFTWRPAPWS